MKVLILEDIIEHQVRLEKTLNEISKEMNIPISYKTTGKVREFMEYVENEEVNQLYFLDIDINGIEKKGFEVAQFIRHRNPYAIIVFITSRSEFATLTYKYKVSALDFIDKDINDRLFKERVAECIVYTKSTLLENQSVVDYFEYSFKGNDICLPYHDILYIETTGTSHKLRIIGKNFSKEFYGTITDIFITCNELEWNEKIPFKSEVLDVLIALEQFNNAMLIPISFIQEIEVLKEVPCKLEKQ